MTPLAPEGITTMTTTQDTVIFKDQAGDYYLIPQGTLERGRVPAGHRADVERLVAESTVAGQDDTQGYFIPAFLIYCAGAAIGSAILIGSSGGDLPGNWPAGFGDD
jgi:hypothetical protein